MIRVSWISKEAQRLPRLRQLIEQLGSPAATVLVFVDSPTVADETAAFLTKVLQPADAWTVASYHAKLSPEEQAAALPVAITPPADAGAGNCSSSDVGGGVKNVGHSGRVVVCTDVLSRESELAGASPHDWPSCAVA